MRLSEERLCYLASLIVNGVWKDDLVEYKDEEEAVKVGRQGALSFLALCEGVEDKVVQKIRSLKRNVIEGSKEWDILYEQYYEEELLRKGLS